MSATQGRIRRLRTRLRLPNSVFTVFAAMLSLGIAALILYPLIRVVLRTFVGEDGLTLAAFEAALAQPDLLRVIVNTVVVVIVGTALAVLIGSTFAWLNERTDAGMTWLTRVLPIVPLLVPPIAGAIGWVLLAAPRSGFLNVALRTFWPPGDATVAEGPLSIFSWYGLIFVYVLYLIPHVYLTVAAGLRNVDPALEEAARISGSGPFATLKNVTLPSIKPAIAAGAVLAIIIGFALFSVPVIIGGQARIEILSVRIVRLMTASFPPRTGVALVLGLLVVAVVGLGWWLQARILRSSRHATIGGRGMRVAPVHLGRWRWLVRTGMIVYLLATSVLPFAALLMVSLQPFWSPDINLAALDLDNYRTIAFDSQFSRGGLRNSILLGVTGATTGMLVAAVIAYFVQRRSDKVWGRAVDGVTKLPGAVTNIVIGIAFISVFAGEPFNLAGTLLLLFLAYIVLYMPQATFNANASLAQVGRELSEASAVSGATEGRTFARVTLPLMVPGMMAGWSLLFVLMAGDITASSMLAGTSNPVIGFVILDLFVNGSFPRIAALAVVISVMSSAVVLTVLRLSRSRRFGGSAT